MNKYKSTKILTEDWKYIKDQSNKMDTPAYEYVARLVEMDKNKGINKIKINNHE